MKCKLSDLMLPAPYGGGFEMQDYWVWCGSVVKGEDSRYHMFASRWPKTLPMHPGWLLKSEVVRASCDTADGTYKFEEVVLPMRGAQFWDGRSTHNPHIMEINGKYVLYYTGMTYPFDDAEGEVSCSDPRVIASRASKRIGVAVSDSVFGPWKRFDSPILNTRPGSFDNFLVSNPAPCIKENGDILLIYKSRSYKEPPYIGELHGKMQFGAAQAQSACGEYKRISDVPLFGGFELEDPFIWRDNDGYNMMAKDMSGEICGEPMGGVYASSADGVQWNFKKNLLFYSRKILWSDGRVREMGNLERPFMLFENGVPSYVFFATSDGKDGMGFANCTKTWNMVIPLKKSEDK